VTKPGSRWLARSHCGPVRAVPKLDDNNGILWFDKVLKGGSDITRIQSCVQDPHGLEKTDRSP